MSDTVAELQKDQPASDKLSKLMAGIARLPDASTASDLLAAQARIMADAGCQCVYVVDSAGALVLEGVRDRVAALVAELGDDAQVGFHGHENLGLGVANSIEAVRAGAKQIDGSCRRFGAGAGNAPVEALIGVFDKIGVKTGIDFFDIADAAEEVVAPAMPEIGRAHV